VGRNSRRASQYASVDPPIPAPEISTLRSFMTLSVRIAYVGLFAEHGLLREDLDAEAIAYAFQATFEGFLRAEADGPAPGTLERRADLLAQTVRRAFESGRPIPAGVASAVIELFAGLAGA
jgi:hypothetical protein